MSRSKKKAIYKDNWKNRTREYWRTIRSRVKNTIRSCQNWEDLEIPHPKTIVNDYDYCDYITDFEYGKQLTNWWSEEDNKKEKEKLSRK